jgi:hypothetical protein
MISLCIEALPSNTTQRRYTYIATVGIKNELRDLCRGVQNNQGYCLCALEPQFVILQAHSLSEIESVFVLRLKSVPGAKTQLGPSERILFSYWMQYSSDIVRRAVCVNLNRRP